MKKFFKSVRKVEAFGVGVELDGATADDWLRLGDALAGALDRQDARWMLMVDELPLFVLLLLREDDSGRRARDFLTWLRNLRQTPGARQQVRWLFAGSIGLDTVTARVGLGDTINDLHLHHLGPFSPDVADRFLAALSATHDFPLGAEVRRHRPGEGRLAHPLSLADPLRDPP